MDARDTEIGDLYRLPVFGEQKVLRFDVAMDDPVSMRVAEAGTNLLDVFQRILHRHYAFAAKLLQVAARHVFENKVVKDRAL